MCDNVPPLLFLPSPHPPGHMFPGLQPGGVNPMLARMGLLLSFRERAGHAAVAAELAGSNTPDSDGPNDLSSQPVTPPHAHKEAAAAAGDQPLDLRVDRKKMDHTMDDGGDHGATTIEDCLLYTSPRPRDS